MIGLNILIGAGAIQGLLLALWLLLKGYQDRSSYVAAVPWIWLGAFVGAFSLVVLSDVLFATRAILEIPYAYQLFDALILALGPLCYGYVRALLGYRPWTIGWRCLHFFPWFLLQSLLLLAVVMTWGERRAVIEADLQHASDSPDLFVLVCGLAAFAYWLRALQLLRRYWRQLEDRYSNAERYKLRWLVQLLSICAILWLLWMLSIVFLWTWADSLAQLGLGIAVYGLGYLGLRQPQLWNGVQIAPETLDVGRDSAASAALDETEARADELDPENGTDTPKRDVEPEKSAQNVEVAAAPARYAKAGVSAGDLAAIGAKISALMAEELTFLEPELSLQDLAKRLNVSPHTLSQTLNMHFEQSFFEYINAWRVKEVQRCFADPAFDQQSILDIALASGFASKATFNATFKRLSGVTPSASRALLQRPKAK
jgi:AraC-like DNA-binding protein